MTHTYAYIHVYMQHVSAWETRCITYKQNIRSPLTILSLSNSFISIQQLIKTKRKDTRINKHCGNNICIQWLMINCKINDRCNEIIFDVNTDTYVYIHADTYTYIHIYRRRIIASGPMILSICINSQLFLTYLHMGHQTLLCITEHRITLVIVWNSVPRVIHSYSSDNIYFVTSLMRNLWTELWTRLKSFPAPSQAIRKMESIIA